MCDVPEPVSPALAGRFFTTEPPGKSLPLVLISHLNAWHALLSRSVMSNSATPWVVAHQAPLSMGILQARKQEWAAMPFSRGSSQPRVRAQVSCIEGGFFTVTREAQGLMSPLINNSPTLGSILSFHFLEEIGRILGSLLSQPFFLLQSFQSWLFDVQISGQIKVLGLHSQVSSDGL